MEKRTIGQFIAVLRKANGMTQKELAERLNVTDKSVSRWERDESAPDLTLIPVIAEIFGVTSDEILRGEKISKTEINDIPQKNTTKQIRNILDSIKTKFNVKCVIAIAIAVMGLIAAMICNLAIVRAYIGFGVACIFFVAAITLVAVSLILSLSSIKDEEIDTENIINTKISLIRRGVISILCVIVIWSTTLPLVTMVDDPHFGLIGVYWLMHGTLYGVITLILCFVIYGLINYSLKSKIADDTERLKLNQALKIKVKCIITGVVLVAVTFLAQGHINNDNTGFIKNVSESVNFTDLEEFKTYIETPSENNDDVDVDYLSAFILDKNGENVLFEYCHKNYDVRIVDYEWINGELIIKTYTRQALDNGETILNIINIGFVALYLLEIVLVFRTSKKKLRSVK